MNHTRKTLLRLSTFIGGLLGLTGLGPHARPAWAQSSPIIVVVHNLDEVHLFGWPAGATVTITVDAPNTPASPDYQTSGTISGAPTVFQLQDSFDIQPGDLVAISSGTLTHTLTVSSGQSPRWT